MEDVAPVGGWAEWQELPGHEITWKWENKELVRRVFNSANHQRRIWFSMARTDDYFTGSTFRDSTPWCLSDG